jgi:altronate dehydratase small subunit
MAQRTRAILINRKDTVATALEPLAKGERVTVEVDDRCEIIEIRSVIPQGHKFALIDMKKGEKVIKYGESIGLSTIDINKGEHVHIHNVASEGAGGTT